MDNGIGLGISMIAIALSLFAPGMGSAIGISYAAQSASGVLRESPDKFGNLFIFVVLPGTQGFYGFIAAFLAIIKLGLLGQQVIYPNIGQGLQLLGASLPIAITGLFSAIHQGKVCVSGVFLAAKLPNEGMKAVIFAAMVETYAVLGLLITFFLLNGIKLGGV